MMGIMPQREDGACIHLSAQNECKIYETRPNICRVDKMYERYKDTLKIDKKAYFKFANECCNAMIKEDGLSDEFLINISSYDEEDGADTT